MLRRILMAGLFACIATGAAAQNAKTQDLNCVRTSLSTSGFVNIQAAESWFPPQVHVRIIGDEAFSEEYGKGSVKRTKGRIRVEFIMASSANVRKTLKFTYIEKSGRYTTTLQSIGNYASTPGGRGTCRLS